MSTTARPAVKKRAVVDPIAPYATRLLEKINTKEKHKLEALVLYYNQVDNKSSSSAIPANKPRVEFVEAADIDKDGITLVFRLARSTTNKDDSDQELIVPFSSPLKDVKDFQLRYDEIMYEVMPIRQLTPEVIPLSVIFYYMKCKLMTMMRNRPKS